MPSCFLPPPTPLLPHNHRRPFPTTPHIAACTSQHPSSPPTPPSPPPPSRPSAVPAPRLPPLLRPISTLLLPAATPTTPHPYAACYPLWTSFFIQRHIFRNAYYVLGTTSLLHSLSLGTASTIALGTAVKWVLKDGLGLATKLLIASKLAPYVDRDCKQFRIAGDFLAACSVAVEILSLLDVSHFLLYATTAAFVREAAHAMSGPPYRVFLDAMARGNIGEVSSRGEAHVVLGNLVGLGIGAALTGAVLDPLPEGGGKVVATMGVYVVLAVAHMRATVCSVKVVQLRSINLQRAALLVDAFVRGDRKSMTLQCVNQNEGVLLFAKLPAQWPHVRFRTSHNHDAVLQREVDGVAVHRQIGYSIAKVKDEVVVTWMSGVSPMQALRALLHVAYVATVDGLRVEEARAQTCRNWETFVQVLKEEGWEMQRVLIELPA